MLSEKVPDRFGLRFTRIDVAVGVSGIVSMGLEILAGRVLAPRFGSTIYTWGSILGISMLALSLGYLHGGRTSYNASFKDLERYLVYTMGYILFVLFAGEFLLSAAAGLPIPPRYASIVPVTVLFGPPTYFLGYVSPYAAQLSSKDTKGGASGHFYAVGTAGSILGAFGTTFLLVPFIPIDWIYGLFAFLTLIPLLGDLGSLKSALPFFVLVFGVFLFTGSSVSGETVYSDSTVYQDLRVSDSDGVRTLYLDGQPQSAVYLNGSGYPWRYLDFFQIPFLMRDDVENVLFVGGGGFVGPQKFAEMGYDVDAVELDPGVVEASERYFNLSEGENLDVFTDDGREFLSETDQEYDVVYLDAFRKSQVPFHLTTKQFMQLVHERMDEDGVVVLNIISTSSGPGSRFARAEYATMDSVFNSTYFFPTRDTGLAQNIELVATKNQRLTEKTLLDRNEDYGRMNLSSEISMLKNFSSRDSIVLTDDYAPVERLLNPLVGRDYVVGQSAE